MVGQAALFLVAEAARTVRHVRIDELAAFLVEYLQRHGKRLIRERANPRRDKQATFDNVQDLAGVVGREVWVIDFAVPGTAILDLRLGAASSEPYALTAFGGNLVFSSWVDAENKGTSRYRCGRARSTRCKADGVPPLVDEAPAIARRSFVLLCAERPDQSRPRWGATVQ